MYLYGMIHRGFSIGCQPMDGLVEKQDANGRRGKNGREFWDILAYNRKLSDQELINFELEEIEEANT